MRQKKQPLRRIRATSLLSGYSLILYYESIDEARKRNKGLIDFEYI